MAVETGDANLPREVVRVKVAIEAESLSKSVLVHEAKQLLWCTERTGNELVVQLIPLFSDGRDHLSWGVHRI